MIDIMRLSVWFWSADATRWWFQTWPPLERGKSKYE
jgi:hypothetical protein